MKISGSATLHADVEKVYQALNDPEVLRAVIPGCEELAESAPDEYRMLVSVGVGSIKGTYKGSVRLSEQHPPHSFVLNAAGAGGPGTVQAQCRVLLIDSPDGITFVEYDADAVVGGMVAGVGQRMLTGVAKKLAAQFFKAVDGVLTGETAVRRPDAAVAAPAETGPAAGGELVAVGRTEIAVPGPSGPATNPLAAFAVGAGVGVAGVLVGWFLGRAGRPGRRR